MVEEVEDLAELEAFLRADPLVNLYALGDLDPFFRPRCTFYGLRRGGALAAVALLYTGDELPALLALGAPPLDELLAALVPRLPRRLYAHLSPGLETALTGRWEVERRGGYLRLGLRHPERLGHVDPAGAVRLGPADLRPLVDLYEASYPEHWFDPRMLETGRYFGIRREGALASVAGVHVFSADYRAAALGNITTHPRHRRQGLARAATAALCRDLVRDADHVGLNVNRDNAAAVRLYRSLGFEEVTTYGEFLAVERPGGARHAGKW